MPRWRPQALIGCLGWIWLACDGGTMPSQDPIVIQGTLVAEDSTWTPLTLLDRNNVVYFEIQELTLDPASLDEPSVGLGFGHPDDEGECITTFSTRQAAGDLLAFRLDGGEWCVLIFDPGSIPSGSTLSYRVGVEVES